LTPTPELRVGLEGRPFALSFARARTVNTKSSGFLNTMKIECPEGSFGAYIFDCDGTIADTMPLHFQAWTHAMEVFGGTFPEELFYEWGGKPTKVIVDQLNAKFGTNLDVEETVHEKERFYLQLLNDVKPIMPVLEIAQRMYGVIPLGVASGGYHVLVDATLRALGITGLFETVVCAEDYSRGKPAPDAFLEAARRLNVEPGRCLVFEDSPTGIAAAEAAGMRWVHVPSEESGRLKERKVEG
jgi:HAD superfamily hydrolase (TIGR01509 family)